MARKASGLVVLAIACLYGTEVSAYLDPAALIFERTASARARRGYQTLVAEGEIAGSPSVPVWDGISSGQGHRRLHPAALH
ncbi:MAG: hypothetical protein HC923_05810 [Myxococcales bacterium]|nr:hypothetical protein [Myxococcales bacterium]